MELPESNNGWIVSSTGQVRAAMLEDVWADEDAAAEGGPREIHQTVEEVEATVAWVKR